MPRYLIDTNAISHYLQGHEPLVSRVDACAKGEIVTSAIVALEFSVGFARGGRISKEHKTLLDAVFKKFPPLDYELGDSYETARVIGRMSLEKREDLYRDMQIASQAKRRKLIAITQNTKDFYKAVGTQVEDWTIDPTARSRMPSKANRAAPNAR